MKCYGEGYTACGSLGDKERNLHKLSISMDGLVHISTHWKHTLLTYDNGDVFAAGDNRYGSIYSNNFTEFKGFMRVPIRENIK